tara:strand:+ start:373 stop:594 length:222 start_codon:yes stop_codon:yes gene_type:complete
MTDNIFEVCKRLNHSDIKTTMNFYSQFKPEELKIDFPNLFELKKSTKKTPNPTTPSNTSTDSPLKTKEIARNF